MQNEKTKEKNFLREHPTVARSIHPQRSAASRDEPGGPYLMETTNSSAPRHSQLTTPHTPPTLKSTPSFFEPPIFFVVFFPLSISGLVY